MMQRAIPLPGALKPLGELVLPLPTPRLRYVRPDDRHRAAHRAFYASDRAAALGLTPEAGTGPDGFSEMARQRAARGFGPFVAELRDTGAAIGLFGPWQVAGQPEPQIKWMLWSGEYEGKGLAFEAAVATTAFAHWVYGWRTAVSYIAPGNRRSIALARRLGCLRDGHWTTPEGITLDTWRHPDPEDL